MYLSMYLCNSLSLYIYHREIYYKELAHVTMEAGKSKICRANVSVWVRRLEAVLEPGRVWKLWDRIILLLRRRSAFGLFRLPADWMRPTHIGEGNLLYSAYWFKCWPHPKTHTDTLRIMSEQTSGHTTIQSNWHKINHDSYQIKKKKTQQILGSLANV